MAMVGEDASAGPRLGLKAEQDRSRDPHGYSCSPFGYWLPYADAVGARVGKRGGGKPRRYQRRMKGRSRVNGLARMLLLFAGADRPS